MNNNQAPNDQPKEISRPITSLPPISMQKKDKIREKKDKKKKNKDKNEKPKVKKYHKRNKVDSYSDNDDGDWSKSISRHNSSTGSERSVRRNKEQLYQQASSNPLDVWVVSSPFFKPLPTVSEIEKVCGDLEKEIIDQNSEKNDNEKHWSVWMKDAVINTINSSHSNSSKNQKSMQQSSNDQPLSRNDSSSLKDSNISNYFINSYGLKKKEYPKPLPSNHAEILFPPEPTPDLSDISSFWCENVQEFPVTDLQIQNYSIIDNILSAFVIAEPDKNHDNFFQSMIIECDSPFSLQKTTEKTEVSIIDNNDIISDKNTKIKNDCEDIFLPTNVPAPHIEFDDYLSHSFEDRLEMELQSVGFIRPDEQHHVNLNNSLAHEFEKYNKELEKLQPQIDKIKKEVLDNLESYKKIEEKRYHELRNYNEILPKKTHKK